MSFNENSVQPEQVQGHMELPPTPDPLATGSPEQPSVLSGATALAWWDAMKFEWKRNASGNGCHLKPQDSYVADVLHRTDHYMTSIAKHELGEDDYAEFAETANLRKLLIQAEDAVDTSGIEGNSIRREVLNRLIIARKICGASAVSAEHRVINERSRENGDVDKMKEDTNGYFVSDVEKRQRWAFKAVRLEFIAKSIADGEVIPTDEAAFAQLLAKRISSSLYNDAVEKGNKLKKPVPSAAASTSDLSTAELLALTA